jgi:hypothetical protein
MADHGVAALDGTPGIRALTTQEGPHVAQGTFEGSAQVGVRVLTTQEGPHVGQVATGEGLPVFLLATGAEGPHVPRAVYWGTQAGVLDTVLSDAHGITSPPSQVQRRRGVLPDLFWPVTAGTHTLSIRVTYTPTDSPRPALRVRGDSSLGVTETHVEAPLVAPGVWATIPVTVTPTGTGVLRVVREFLNRSASGSCYWDQIRVT